MADSGRGLNHRVGRHTGPHHPRSGRVRVFAPLPGRASPHAHVGEDASRSATVPLNRMNWASLIHRPGLSPDRHGCDPARMDRDTGRLLAPFQARAILGVTEKVLIRWTHTGRLLCVHPWWSPTLPPR